MKLIFSSFFAALLMLSLLLPHPVSSDGQNLRRVRRRVIHKQVRVQRIEESSQTVKDDCSSGANIEGCSINLDAPEPKTYPCEFGLKDVICLGRVRGRLVKCSGGRLI